MSHSRRWIDRCGSGSRRGSATRARADATIVIATHDVEPFVHMARRAIVVTRGAARVVYPLPDEHDARMTLLDRSARSALP